MPPRAGLVFCTNLPMVQPQPAPCGPWATPLAAAVTAARPIAASGVTLASPTPRSNKTAAGTMGTRAMPISMPMPDCAKKRMTPSAAARPKALPPLKTTACACSTRLPGRRTSVSRVPGAAPRTLTPAIAPSRGPKTTVTPVRADSFSICPTRMPCTFVISPGYGCIKRSFPWRRPAHQANPPAHP